MIGTGAEEVPMRCAYDEKNIFENEVHIPRTELEGILAHLKRRKIPISCKQEAQTGKRFCLFHDPEAHKSRGSEISRELMQLIERGEHVFVGYNLPEIDLKVEKPLSMVFALCHFHGDFAFSGKLEQADFSGATFHAHSFFLGAAFGKMSSFFRTAFSERCYFDEAVFSDGAEFTNAIFKGRTSFHRSRIHGILNFSDATFNGSLASFTHIRFPSGLPMPFVLMDRTTFGRDTSVVFSGTNLSWFFFCRMNIEELDFNEVSWCRKAGHYVLGAEQYLRTYLRFGGESLHNAQTIEKWRGLVYGFFKITPPIDTPDSVAAEYRAIRSNYEAHKRYAEAGNFFIGEMDTDKIRPLFEDVECKRFPLSQLHNKIVNYESRLQRDAQEPFWRRVSYMILRMLYYVAACFRTGFSLHGAYDILGRYGESVLRPAGWLAFLLFLPALIELFIAQFSTQVYPSVLEGIGNRLLLIFQMKTPTRLEEFLERAFGALLLGIIFIAARRKLERYR